MATFIQRLNKIFQPRGVNFRTHTYLGDHEKYKAVYGDPENPSARFITGDQGVPNDFQWFGFAWPSYVNRNAVKDPANQLGLAARFFYKIARLFEIVFGNLFFVATVGLYLLFQSIFHFNLWLWGKLFDSHGNKLVNSCKNVAFWLLLIPQLITTIVSFIVSYIILDSIFSPFSTMEERIYQNPGLGHVAAVGHLCIFISALVILPYFLVSILPGVASALAALVTSTTFSWLLTPLAWVLGTIFGGAAIITGTAAFIATICLIVALVAFIYYKVEERNFREVIVLKQELDKHETNATIDEDFVRRMTIPAEPQGDQTAEANDDDKSNLLPKNTATENTTSSSANISNAMLLVSEDEPDCCWVNRYCCFFNYNCCRDTFSASEVSEQQANGL